MVYKIVICDDNKKEAELLESAFDILCQYLLEYGVYFSVEKLLKHHKDCKETFKDGGKQLYFSSTGICEDIFDWYEGITIFQCRICKYISSGTVHVSWGICAKRYT